MSHIISSPPPCAVAKVLDRQEEIRALSFRLIDLSLLRDEVIHLTRGQLREIIGFTILNAQTTMACDALLRISEAAITVENEEECAERAKVTSPASNEVPS